MAGEQAKDSGPTKQGGNPGADDRKRGTTRERIIGAAAELFHEQSPSGVSLREIARRADVNYGLIHQCFGTKEAILAEVFRRASDHGTELIAGAPDVAGALGTWGRSDNLHPYARMLASALLDNAQSEAFRQESSAVQRIAELVQERWTQTDAADSSSRTRRPAYDPRVLAALAVVTTVGWSLLEPFVIPAAALEERDIEAVREEVLGLFLSMVDHAAPENPDASAPNPGDAPRAPADDA